MLPFRVIRALSVVLLLTASLAPSARAQADERFFSQTSFRIDDNSFWDFFQHRGMVRTFGYPVSRTFMLDGFQVQIFPRLVMQKQPDGSVQTLNLLDAGLMPYTKINGSTYPAPDPAVVSATPPATNLDAVLEFVLATAPDVWEGEPVNFGTTFFTTVTAADAPDADPALLPGFDLQIWGAPTSNPARDPANSNFIYQRFQRSIMHYDKTCGCTQGLLLADYLKSIMTGQNLPPDLDAQAKGSKYYKQYAPGQPKSIARPAELPNSDLTDAFTQQQAGVPGQTQPSGPVSSAFAYGFQVHMWDMSSQAKEFAVTDVGQAGFNWLKQQVEWYVLETAPGTYNWGELDTIVNMANAAGLKILLSVAHAPTIYRSPSSGLMPSDPANYQTLMQTIAARYKGKVQAYELWNEQNLAREAGAANINPATYLPLLKAGYSGVKAGDNAALALLGGLSPTGNNTPGEAMDDLAYLQALYAINNGEAKNYFDVATGHLSGFSNPPDCTPATPQCSLSGGWNNHPSFFAFYRLGQYHDAMIAAGDGNKPIWLTEFGYDSCTIAPSGYEYCTSISEDTQARFLTQAVTMARQTPYIGGLMVWNLNFQVGLPETDEKWGFGVLRGDWSGRPAYFALVNMAKN
ncbi:MAG TPA: cellulase family glycosylhydrolase [Chloroflexota bacterium]|nr:cellulase family glycosylhydrolase [Chloroflexota bacterium]